MGGGRISKMCARRIVMPSCSLKLRLHPDSFRPIPHNLRGFKAASYVAARILLFSEEDGSGRWKPETGRGGPGRDQDPAGKRIRLVNNPDTDSARARHYFVDEAGDGALFGRRGKLLIGTEGCSRYFMLGLLDVEDPDELARDLSDLRQRLLRDPYFKGVPSMQPEQRKTHLAFHAKDDLPEVRREVFQALLRHRMRFFAVIRDKQSLLSYVRQQNERNTDYRYNQSELYDTMVSRLFKDRLHKDDLYHIHFARRWKSDRTVALKSALRIARNRFALKWGIQSSAPMNIMAANPVDVPCLQSVDYCLWSLQRLYERGEERYLELLWPVFHLVHDVDDVRMADYGTYYTQKKPLGKAAFLSRKPRI